MMAQRRKLYPRVSNPRIHLAHRDKNGGYFIEWNCPRSPQSWDDIGVIRCHPDSCFAYRADTIVNMVGVLLKLGLCSHEEFNREIMYRGEFTIHRKLSDSKVYYKAVNNGD